MKIVFMGTPDFAVPSLRALAGAGLTVQAVVTRPDRPRGRGNRVLPSPVKEAALDLGITVYQPVRVKEKSFISLLSDLKPDAVAVVAFGQVLPAELLAVPALGCINVHASLLPRFRGAAPIQRAIMEGESETGVTTMKMDPGLDTGDILLKAATAIRPEDNFGSLHDRLAGMGGPLLVETLRLLADGKLKGIPQDGARATYAPPIGREDEIIDWTSGAESIKNRVRALDPWPGARTRLGGKVLKIWRVDVPAKPGSAGSVPGRILGPVEGGLAVQCGDRPLVVRELQLEGGKRLGAADFLRGARSVAGAVLG